MQGNGWLWLCKEVGRWGTGVGKEWWCRVDDIQRLCRRVVMLGCSDGWVGHVGVGW